MEIRYLDKTRKEEWLPKLFDLLYENMGAIAPSGLTYEEEREMWMGQVSPGLEHPSRQIILCLTGDELSRFSFKHHAFAACDIFKSVGYC